MEQLEKLIEKGVDRILALVISWNYLSQEHKKQLDFEVLCQVWKSFPNTSPERDELEILITEAAKNFDQYLWGLENAVGNQKIFFGVLKKIAKGFNQRLLIWERFYRYSDDETDSERTEIWSWLKKKATTLRRSVKLWETTGKGSNEEEEAIIMIKGHIKDFADCQFLLEDCFSNVTSEWKEIFLLAEKKAKTFEQHLWLWENELDEKKDAMRWSSAKSKAKTLDQRIWLFEVAPYQHASECLEMARKKLE